MMGTKYERPSWDEFWFTQALMYSTRATCDRLRTATLIVKNKKMVGAGYNGSMPGADHCDDVGHLIIEDHCMRTLHGEQNAIINTSREDLRGSTAYILGTPCLRCLKELVAAGVVIIKCLGTYDNAFGKTYLEDLAIEAGVDISICDYAPKDLIDGAIKALERKGGRLYSGK